MASLLFQPDLETIFPTLSLSQEASLIMPTSNTDVLNRITKIEDRVESYRSESTDLSRQLATLQTSSEHHSSEIQKLGSTIETLRNLVDQRTSESRTVTWKQLAGFTGALIAVLLPILGLISTGFYTWVLPTRIEEVAVESKSLGHHLDSVIENHLREPKAQLQSIENDSKQIKGNLNALIEIVRPNLTRKNVISSLKRNTSGDSSSLLDSLSSARDVLQLVIKEKISLQRQDFKELSVRLYDDYVSASDNHELRSELRATFAAAADAKSISERNLLPISEAVISQAKENGNYFEGRIDLSSKTNWKGAVFNKCTIVIGNPDVPVILEGVRFFNCGFEELPDAPPARDLVSTFLETTSPTIDFAGSKVDVDYKINPPTERRAK